jgi:multiple sugar transport system permease protein
MLADKPFSPTSLEAGASTRIAKRLSGLSDRAIAWLFILPTILLLLAINIFPLIWALRLSFTNFKSNMPSVPARFVGIDNYVDILTDEDIWYAMQVTAHFVFWSVGLEVLLGFGLA